MNSDDTPRPSFITFMLSGADLCTYTATYTTAKQNKMTDSRSLAFPCEEEFMVVEGVNTDFLSNEEFGKRNSVEGSRRRWKHVIVKLHKRDGTIIIAWATKLIKENLAEKPPSKEMFVCLFVCRSRELGHL